MKASQAVLVVLSLFLPLCSLESGSADGPSALRSVTVAVVARDQQGQSVRDLRGEEFEVRDAGRRQHVTLKRPLDRLPYSASVSGPDEFSNRSTNPPTNATFILLDLLNENFTARSTEQPALFRSLRSLDVAERGGRQHRIRGRSGERKTIPVDSTDSLAGAATEIIRLLGTIR